MAQEDFGAFISTTNIFDIISDKPSPAELKEFIVQLSYVTNQLALLLNIKDTGYYVDQEFVCGQLYFPNPALTVVTPASGQVAANRQVYRKVVNCGALPNSITKTIAHGIDVLAADGATNYAGFTFTRIYGTASDSATRDYIPLPYVAGVNGAAVSLEVNETNIFIGTADDKTNFNTCYVVLEYLKE